MLAAVLAAGSRAVAQVQPASTLKIEPPVLDYGMIPAGKVATASARLINTGTTPLKIISSRASCGCSHARLWPNTVLQSGESRDVSIPLFARATPGPVPAPKITFVVENQPEVELTLKATSVAPEQCVVKAEPPVLDFGEIPTTMTSVATFKLINTSDKPVRIIRPRVSSGAMIVNVPGKQVLAPGEVREVPVSLSGGAVAGPVHGKRIRFFFEKPLDSEVEMRAGDTSGLAAVALMLRLERALRAMP